MNTWVSGTGQYKKKFLQLHNFAQWIELITTV